MAFRTSRIYKALDKHDVSTPQQIKDLVAAGDDAELIDGATGQWQRYQHLKWKQRNKVFGASDIIGFLVPFKSQFDEKPR